MNRTRIKIVGQSGKGLLTTGELIAKGLQKLGFHLCTDREFPSLIKGGHSCYTINFATHPIQSLSNTADLLVAIDKHCLLHYFETLKKEGILIHGYEKLAGINHILESAKKKKISVQNILARQVAQKNGGTPMMTNIILTGMAWKILGFDLKIMQKLVEQKFAKKEAILKIAKKCLKAGYDSANQKLSISCPTSKKFSSIFLDGNHAIALGAIHAGMRAYIAYPMSPASSILSHCALMSKETHLLIKQAEDEITAVQMVVGAMYAGTRSMTSTSGGGYDLMTETVSLAGMIEVPLVIVVVQRPGPGTGLPTWTAQADLNMAINSSHGEFPRIVLSVSNPQDCFENIQHAFNLAEKYQTPVIVLSEKVIAESKITIKPFKQKQIPIKRYLVDNKNLENLKQTDRYEITKSGISKRWLPGSSKSYFFCNGDEHKSGGQISEDGDEVKAIYEKRMRKLLTIKKELPDPVIYGSAKNADISFVGWGSSKNVILDIIEKYKKQKIAINYLHYEYLWPLRTKKFDTFCQQNKNIHLIEGNYQGQLGNLLEGKSNFKFKNRLLKWNGRSFFLEDIENYLKKNLS